MNNNFMKKLLALVLLLTVAFTPIALADYAQTTVWFTVASSISFTVTLPDATFNTSNGIPQPGSPTTSDIWFNSTANNNASIMPCVTGLTACQSADMATTPIFQYDNTGTSNIDINIYFASALPSGVTVGMNSSSTCAPGCQTYSTIFGVNGTSPAYVVRNLTYIGTNVSNAFLNATFTAVPAGSNSRILQHVSNQTV